MGSRSICLYKINQDQVNGLPGFQIAGSLDSRETLRMTVGDDGPHRRMLMILDVSNEGLMAKGNDPIPVNTPVDMEVIVDEHPVEIRGDVIHCTGTLGGFKIGIQLDRSEDAASDLI